MAQKPPGTDAGTYTPAWREGPGWARAESGPGWEGYRQGGGYGHADGPGGFCAMLATAPGPTIQLDFFFSFIRSERRAIL